MKIFGLRIPFTKEVGGSVVGSLQSVRVPGLFGFARESFAGAWQQGVVVDDRQTILSASPVFACINRISSDIAKLRIRLVEQVDGGIWKEVERNSPYWGVLRKPNSYQNRIQFFMSWLSSKLMFGNTYVLKVRDQRGLVVAMHVLDPRLVQPLVTNDGDVYYRLGGDLLAGLKLASLTLPAMEIIHDRAITLFHPLVGVSPIFACAMSATQRNRMQSDSALFFTNMSRPSGVLLAPGEISDETAAELKAYWEKNFTGANSGKLAVLGDNLKYQPMSVNAKDSELVAQLGWTDADIARAFDMPAYKIGVGPIPTNNNVEALNQQYYDGCLQIHIESIELCLDEGLGLLAADRTYGTEFDLDGLLRMDSATMFDALGKAIGSGAMAPNEARMKMNLPKVAGGNSPFMQQQNWSLEQLAKRDIMNDKPAVAAPEPAAAPAAPAKEVDEAAIQKMVDAAVAAAITAAQDPDADEVKAVEQLSELICRALEPESV